MNASEIKLPYGKYRGKTLDEIASTREGLLYLDNMVDEFPRDSYLKKAIKDFLSDPTIQKELDDLLGE